MRLAKIEDGFIATVSIHNPSNPHPPGQWMPLEEAIASGIWYKPQVQVTPDEVPLYSFRTALRRLGLFEVVEAKVSETTEPPQVELYERLEYGNTIHRSMAEAFGLTAEQMEQALSLANSFKIQP